MTIATSQDVGNAICEALGIEGLNSIRSITIIAEAGEGPMVHIVRYINREQVSELREVMKRFQAGEVKRSPEDWCTEFGFKVLDPDGWREGSRLGAKSWRDPISRDEFMDRAAQSTVSNMQAFARSRDEQPR